VAELLENFRFLPSWRIDDVMISFAAPGGSVGPHFDNYDVFLLQGHGKRNWKIGQMCSSDSPLLQHADLRILAEFEQSDEWTLEPGDMLYLPPRLAHYGVAVDDCLTYSVGFRAPSAAEVLTHFTDFLGQFLPDEERYTDADAQPVSDPHQIQHDALDRLKALLDKHMSDKDLLLTWFGQFMTEPRYPEQVAGEELSEEDLINCLEQGAVLIRNPSARLAWSESTTTCCCSPAAAAANCSSWCAPPMRCTSTTWPVAAGRRWPDADTATGQTRQPGVRR
jgi:50S ribosomal protein L16 3-hydroxylase